MLDYKNLTCLEIDLSNQTLESLEDFLLKSNKDRKWLNNEIYFNGIELKYSRANKLVRLVEEAECMHCELCQQCCAVRKSGCPSELLVIDNSGKKYRLCKPNQYAVAIEDYRQRMKAEENRNDTQEVIRDPSERSCFDCESNLRWANREDGYANCGAWQSLGVSKRTPPECAHNCRRFRIK